MYTHEQQERKIQTKPMNTSLPVRAVNPADYRFAEAYLTSRNLDADIAQENGWYPSWEAGDNFPRIVIPAVTHVAGHVYWQARDMTGKAKIRYQSPSGPRHEALIEVRSCWKEPKGQVVVEGPMDALAAAGAGYTGFALMGMMPSLATLMHLGLLLNLDEPVLVLLDRDAGHESVRITTLLAANGFRARRVLMPGSLKDLAACDAKGREHLLDRLSHNLPC
jgi:hypothetical protein